MIKAFQSIAIFTCALSLLMLCAVPAYAVEGRGGGPGKSGVNKYTPQGQCAYPRESTCSKPRVEESILPIVPNYVTALQLMAEQLSSSILYQTFIIGTFFDADVQLDAQRNLDRLKARAHKDYHPSAQMCRFGSFIKSVAHSEEKSDLNKAAFNQALINRYSGKSGMASSTGGGYAGDVGAQLDLFKTQYCDPRDYNTGMQSFCEAKENPTDKDRVRYNKDIDYVRVAGVPLTLDVDFTDGRMSDEEADIFTLARSLYWPNTFEVQEKGALENSYQTYMAKRQNMAKHVVAHNSFITQVAMKAAGSGAALGVQSGGAYMKALMREFGLEDGDIEELLGENPSYYAQMEVLAKKIYQNPDFYTNLYDKPANVERINASLEAIQLMQGRDYYEMQLRQEMLISQMLDERLRGPASEASAQGRIKPLDF